MRSTSDTISNGIWSLLRRSNNGIGNANKAQLRRARR